MADDPLILGQAYLKGGNYSAARAQAEKALAVSAQNNAAWSLLHGAVKQSSSRKAGHDLAEKWLEALPDSQEALYELALGTISLRKSREKSQSLVESYQLKYPEAIRTIKIMRCSFELTFGDKKIATRLAREIAGDNKNLADFLIFEGMVNCEAGCCREAYKLGKDAVRLAPENARAWRLLAVAAFREMRFNEARRAAANAQEIDPNIPSMQIIKTIALFGWFPLFALGSLLALIALRCACVFSVKSFIIRSALQIICAYTVTAHVLFPILQAVAVQLVKLGLPDLLLTMFIALALWLIVPELLFHYSERDKAKKRASVKLKKY